MEISPLLLFTLLLYSALLGVALGVLNDIFRITRVFCGVHYSEKKFGKWYEKKLPVVHRPLDAHSHGRWTKLGLQILIFIQDIFLFVAAGAGAVILNYEYSSGHFRLYTIPAVIVGFAVYYFTLGKLVMIVSEGVVFLIRAALTVTVAVIAKPFCFIFRLIRRFFEKIGRFFGSAIAKRKKLLYNKNKKVKLLRESETGFLSADVRKVS